MEVHMQFRSPSFHR